LPPSTTTLDVKQFGAIGDGKHDDAPAIQNAIDAAQKQRRALFVPAGQYLINATLTVRNSRHPSYSGWSSLRLVGEGNLGQQSTVTPGRPLTALLAFQGASRAHLRLPCMLTQGRRESGWLIPCEPNLHRSTLAIKGCRCRQSVDSVKCSLANQGCGRVFFWILIAVMINAE
jgi:hypothetical protein